MGDVIADPACAKGRHAWGSVRYGDKLMYEYGDDELRANALEELADAINYLMVLGQRKGTQRKETP